MTLPDAKPAKDSPGTPERLWEAAWQALGRLGTQTEVRVTIAKPKPKSGGGVIGELITVGVYQGAEGDLFVTGFGPVVDATLWDFVAECSLRTGGATPVATQPTEKSPEDYAWEAAWVAATTLRRDALVRVRFRGEEFVAEAIVIGTGMGPARVGYSAKGEDASAALYALSKVCRARYDERIAS
ncbi:MAG: hypothetical protein JNK72_24955 [Myxococcales bacterium]|nr:hypothetical protein [Myxococcales bacterium]